MSPKRDLPRLRPATHHFIQHSNRWSLHKTNCRCQIRLVLGLRTTTTIPGSTSRPLIVEEKDTSPILKPSTSAGRNKPVKPNHKASPVAHHCRRSQPSAFQPSFKQAMMIPSKQNIVIGIRDRVGFRDLHPWIAFHVPRKRGPDSLSLRCKPKTPKVTQ